MSGIKVFSNLKNAIFQIFLIVVGILLALQVDNWKENRKERVFELKILQGVHRDLQSNAQKLQQLIDEDEDLIAGNEKLLEIIRDPASKFSGDLEVLFGSINRYSVFYPQRLSYETLKSRGLEVVKNETLRSEIVNLYDYSYMVNSEVEMELKRGLYENSNVVFLRQLDTGDEVYLKIPNDFDALKMDQEFINHLAHVTGEQKTLTLFSIERLEETLSVITDLENEIDRLAD